MNKLSLTANIISIVAGVMTILGISGIVSWSLFSKDRGPFQQKVAAVLAFSLKTAYCLVGLVVVGVGALSTFVLIAGMSQTMFGKGRYGSENAFWDASFPVPYVLAYVFIALLFVPLYVVLCSCIYEWSLDPFRRLRKAIRGDKS